MPKQTSIAKRKSRNNKTINVRPRRPQPRDEVTILGSALRKLGGIAGGLAGGLVGSPAAGSAIGTGLGASLSKWLGSGDYDVRSNSIVQKFSGSGSIPMMHKTNQSIIVRHREYITDISSSTGFAIAGTFAINPGLASTFPWLSSVAQQYQEYTIRGMVFEFISTAGSAVSSTNNALGTVMMATNYRATAAAFINKQQMLNEFFSTDSKPSENFCHPIECDPSENPYNVQYVRGSAVPAGEDQKTYDLGVMTVATEGMQAANIDVGELWVSYEVELRKPVLTGNIDTYGGAAHYYSATSVSTTNPLGTARTVVADYIGLTLTNNKVTFPLGTSGTFQVTVAWASATATSIPSAFTSLVNCVKGISPQNSISAVDVFSGGATTANYAIATTFITISDPTLVASFILSPTTLTGATQVDIWLGQTRLSFT